MSQVWYYNGCPSDADPACRVQTAAAVVIVVTRQKVVQRSDNFESRGARSRHRGIFLMQLRPGKLWIWGPGAMFEVSRVNSRYLWTLGQCWRGSRSTAVWFRKGCTSAPVQREDHQTPPVEHNKQHQIRQSCRPASIQCVCVCVWISLFCAVQEHSGRRATYHLFWLQSGGKPWEQKQQTETFQSTYFFFWGGIWRNSGLNIKACIFYLYREDHWCIHLMFARLHSEHVYVWHILTSRVWYCFLLCNED